MSRYLDLIRKRGDEKAELDERRQKEQEDNSLNSSLSSPPAESTIVCCVCQWTAPYGATGVADGKEYLLCRACAQAERDKPQTEQRCCEMYCETPLKHLRRVDPGGLLACATCLTKVELIRERMRLQAAKDETIRRSGSTEVAR